MLNAEDHRRLSAIERQFERYDPDFVARMRDGYRDGRRRWTARGWVLVWLAAVAVTAFAVVLTATGGLAAGIPVVAGVAVVIPGAGLAARRRRLRNRPPLG